MRIKRISEILSRLIDVTMVNTSTINDFTPGSTIRSIYEAVALEIDQFYILTKENITWGIQEGVLNAFDFTRRPAKKAYGTLRIDFSTTVAQDFAISKGTTFESSLAEYIGTAIFETAQEYIVPKGATTALVDVYCTQTGTIGNFPKNTINRMMNSMSNIQKITNEQDFLTGSEEESLEDLKQRFRNFVETRSRATNKAIDYGTRLVENITGVYVYEQVGLVTVFCHDNNGNLGNELKEEVEKALEEYRPAGIKLVVAPVERKALDLEVTVYATTNMLPVDFTTTTIRSISNFLNTKEVGQNFIEAEINQLVMNLNDYVVSNVVTKLKNTDLSSVDGETQIEKNELIRANDITLVIKESIE